jgi:hypothetical protein
MTDTPADPSPPAGPSIDDKLTAMKTEILGAVRDMLGHHGNPSPSPGPAAPAGDLQSQIDAAVAKVTADRDKADADKAHQAEHEQMKAAAAEKPPMERKRVHGLMGWGEPAK